MLLGSSNDRNGLVRGPDWILLVHQIRQGFATEPQKIGRSVITRRTRHSCWRHRFIASGAPNRLDLLNHQDHPDKYAARGPCRAGLAVPTPQRECGNADRRGEHHDRYIAMQHPNAGFGPDGQRSKHEPALWRWSALRLQLAESAVAGTSAVHGEPLIVLHAVQFQEVAVRTTIGVARFDVFEAPFTVALGTCEMHPRDSFDDFRSDQQCGNVDEHDPQFKIDGRAPTPRRVHEATPESRPSLLCRVGLRRPPARVLARQAEASSGTPTSRSDTPMAAFPR